MSEMMELDGHKIKREIDGNDLLYRCVDCQLVGEEIQTFDRYPCDNEPR